MVYMFNELSLSEVNSREEVCSVMETFVNTYIKASDTGLNELRFHESGLTELFQKPLAYKYNINFWLQDKKINDDLKDRFRTILLDTPLIKLTEQEQNEHYSMSEFFKKLDDVTTQVWGLGATFVYDTICFSLTTHNEWSKTEVEISHYFLDEDTKEVFSSEMVRQFSDENTLINHKNWYYTKQRDNLKKSSDLWSKRKELFPNLEFLDTIEKQFETLGDSMTLTKILNALLELNTFARNWKTGNFNLDEAVKETSLIMSHESPPTINKFSAQRTFTIPYIGRKLFELHIKLGEIRIHFYPDNISQNIYIGYVGKHLRIASEN